MASYKLAIKQSAAKELEALPNQYRPRVVSRIQALASDPRPDGCQKLSGKEQYRIRQGQYRVLYEVDDVNRVVTIVKIGHRRDIYR